LMGQGEPNPPAFAIRIRKPLKTFTGNLCSHSMLPQAIHASESVVVVWGDLFGCRCPP
jgi:hypothetical protein